MSECDKLYKWAIISLESKSHINSCDKKTVFLYCNDFNIRTKVYLCIFQKIKECMHRGSHPKLSIWRVR